MLLFHCYDIIVCFQLIMPGENCAIYRSSAPKTTPWVKLYFSNTGGTFLQLLFMIGTAQKMKFSIKDFFSKCNQSTWNCGFGHIYWRNPWWKTLFFVEWESLKTIWKVKLKTKHCVLVNHSHFIYPRSSIYIE